MVDSALVVAVVGVGLTALSLGFAISSWKKRQRVAAKALVADPVLEVEREILLQKKQELEYRKTRDFFHVLGWIWERLNDEADEEYDEDY